MFLQNTANGRQSQIRYLRQEQEDDTPPTIKFRFKAEQPQTMIPSRDCFFFEFFCASFPWTGGLHGFFLIIRPIARTGRLRLLLRFGLINGLGKAHIFRSRNYASCVSDPYIPLLPHTTFPSAVCTLLLILVISSCPTDCSLARSFLPYATRASWHCHSFVVSNIKQSFPENEEYLLPLSSSSSICQCSGKSYFCLPERGHITPWKRRIMATSNCNRYCEKPHQH